MIIKELNASFGNLKNQKLELKPGLNVIYAPNESGKSTWCAFIRAMLYGLNTSARDRADALSDKTRFRPWSGGDMEGTMTVSHRGRDITITRTAQGHSPMKRLRAVDSAGDAVDITGEMLTGVSEEVFTRTAFIGQAGMKVSPSGDLEKRMNALAASGSEEMSWSQTDARLRSWRRRLRHNKSGLIPALEGELEKNRERLRQLETAYSRTLALEDELTELENRQIELKKQLIIHEKLKIQSEKHRIREARQAADEAESRAEELRTSMTVNGRIITRQEVTDLKSELRAADTVRISAEEQNRIASAARRERTEIGHRLDRLPIKGISPEEGLEIAQKVTEYREITSKQRENKRQQIVKSALGAVGVLALIAALILLFSAGDTAAVIALFTVSALAAVVFGFMPRPGRQADQAVGEYLRRFGVSDVGKLAKILEDYVNLSAAFDDASRREQRAESAVEAAADNAEKMENRLIVGAQALFPAVSNREALEQAISDAERRIGRLEEAERDRDANRQLYIILTERFTGDLNEPDEPLTVPDRDEAAARRLYDRTAAQAAEKRKEYDQAVGQLHAMGDPAAVKGEISRITDELAAAQRRYQAMTVAIDAMKEADSQLRTRFSPIISRLAGEYMSRMTGGRYEALQFDRGFAAQVLPSGDPVSRSALSLSQGTADQLYLSLRLALCGLLLPGPDPCPIILDDALVTFDDERMKRAMELLEEIAKERQVILFSCQNREKNHYLSRP